jgi:hypothetical protein
MNYKIVLVAIVVAALWFSCSSNVGGYSKPRVFASRATLEGIDSDGDGVRDDVWEFIVKRYPKPDQEHIRQALAQRAKEYQNDIIYGAENNRTLAKAYAHAGGGRAGQCMIVKFPNKIVYDEIDDALESKVVNTDERLYAYWNSSALTSGDNYSSKDFEFPCEYDEKVERELNAAFGAKTLEEINPNLPPDPGSAGKATLEGIDADNDGLRDDVQRAIWLRAPRPDQNALRLAMMQFAKARQEMIVMSSSSDLEAMFQTYKKELLALHCLEQYTKTFEADKGTVYFAVRNTQKRSEAIDLFQRRVDGYMWANKDKDGTWGISTHEIAYKAIRCDF